MSRLDPELAATIDRLTEAGWLPIVRETAEDSRRNYAALARARSGDGVAEVGDVTDAVVTGPDADVAVRTYRPAGTPRGLTVVWLHGGGWVIGNLETADAAARRVCRHLDATVVSVDYRLAPEHPHPAPLQDCLAALRWAAEQHPADRVVVGGDSAGAGLAAGCALLARDWGPRLDAQLLLYPGLDPSMESASIAQNAEGPFLTSAELRWFYAQYVPDVASRHDPAVALGEVGTHDRDGLDGLAPAVVAVAELDPLRDEGSAHARRLEAAGVPTRLLPGAGLCHGYFGLAAGSTAARVEGDRALDALAELLGSSA